MALSNRHHRVSEEEYARVHAVLDVARIPVKRAALADATGLTERKIRAAVALMVERGLPVVSTGAGFRISTDSGEIARGAAILRAAALSAIHRAAKLERITPAAFAQKVLFDLEAEAA